MESDVGGHTEGLEFDGRVIDAVVFVEGPGEGFACFEVEFVVGEDVGVA